MGLFMDAAASSESETQRKAEFGKAAMPPFLHSWVKCPKSGTGDLNQRQHVPMLEQNRTKKSQKRKEKR